MIDFIFNSSWQIALIAVLALYGLWLFYLAVMSLYRAKRAGTLTPFAYNLALPIVMLGYLLDVLVNFFVMTIVLLELPKWQKNSDKFSGIEVEWTVTARLSRHIHDSTGWRRAIARWMGDNLLDQFDPSGKHLK